MDQGHIVQLHGQIVKAHLMSAYQGYIQIFLYKLTVFFVMKEATKTITVTHIVVCVVVNHTPIQKDKQSAPNAVTA